MPILVQKLTFDIHAYKSSDQVNLTSSSGENLSKVL